MLDIPPGDDWTQMPSRARKALRLQLLPLIAGFVVLSLIVGARTFLVESQLEDNEAVRRAFEVEQHVATTMSLLQDAESGQRGFALTGEDAYLEAYNTAVASLPAEFDALRAAMVADGERQAQLAQLEEAAGERLTELAETVNLIRAGKQVEALAIIRADRGKVAMDRVRDIVGSLRRDESAELQARLAAADRTSDRLRWAAVASLVAVLCLGIFSTLNLRRRLLDIETAHVRLTDTNAALVAEMANREAAESQVRQMQKMEAVGQLTGGIAHDFNNMLGVVISAMNLVQRKLSRGDTDIGRYVEAASDAATRAANLTSRLLAFSRQQPLAPQVIDVNRLVTGMSDLLHRTLSEPIEIETVLGGGLWKTSADPSQLENAIVNLAVNARDAMPDGGKMTIETANAHLDDAYAASHSDVRAGQFVLVAVSDTGTGMPPETVARAFDPFFTTKPVGKGTGLGLSQVFGFVKQSGGHVKIYSEPGQGTTVKLYLPRYFGEDVQAAGAADAAKAGTGETILLVEDDERVRNVTVSALRDLGYHVVAAAGADEALRKLASHPKATLLFTDIVMPGKNGRKLADEALRLRPGLKLLFTTGFTRNAVVHNGVLDHGVNFIAKPFTIDQLAAKLREVLDA
jgi:signal transduction histidine kinase